MNEDLLLRPLDESDEADVRAVLQSQAAYTERVTGLPPGPADALSLLLSRPPGVADDDKAVFGAQLGGRLAAVVDVLRSWPDPRTVHVGLLLVHRGLEGRGVGRRTHELLVERASRWPGLDRLRLAVVQTNAEVEGFWRALGYTPTGEAKPYRYAALQSEARIFTRPLP